MEKRRRILINRVLVSPRSLTLTLVLDRNFKNSKSDIQDENNDKSPQSTVDERDAKRLALGYLRWKKMATWLSKIRMNNQNGRCVDAGRGRDCAGDVSGVQSSS